MATRSNNRLSANSSVGAALCQIAKLEADFAAERISSHMLSKDDELHECRKAIKRLRAVARLGDTVAHREARSIDHLLKNVGRALSATRDAAAVANSFARLVEVESELASLKGVAQIMNARIEVETPVPEIRDTLDDVGARFPAYFCGRYPWSFLTVVDGIVSTYADASKKMRRFERKDRASRAHAWRKSVQRLANQLGVIDSFCSESLSARRSDFAMLATALGEHHDLALLRARLKHERLRLPRKTRRHVRDVAKRNQSELRQRALELGVTCFADDTVALRADLLSKCADSPVTDRTGT